MALAIYSLVTGASLVAQMVKNLPATQETLVQSLGREDPPWRREWWPTPVFLPGEFHGLCSPWGRKESDTTEQLSPSFHFHSLFILYSVHGSRSVLSWLANNCGNCTLWQCFSFLKYFFSDIALSCYSNLFYYYLTSFLGSFSFAFL